MTSTELRDLRTILNITQAQLAKQLGYSEGHIRHMESGNRAIPLHAEIAIKRFAQWIEQGKP